MGQDTGQGQWRETGDWTGATAVGRRKKRKEKNTMQNETFDAKKDAKRKISDAKQCDAKQLMRKNDAKYAKKYF